MIYTNCHIENNPEIKDIVVENGKIKEIIPHREYSSEIETIDLNGKLVIPPFVESHIHLDATHTAEKFHFLHSASGSLFDGISNWAKIKAELTEESIYQNALTAVKQEVSHGVQFIRTHVDTDSVNNRAIKALLKLKEDLKELVTIQLIAFPQDGIESHAGAKEKMKEACKLGVDGIGAIPHYEYSHEYAVASLDFATSLAAENGLLVDVHCDETDDPSSVGLETLAVKAIEYSLYDRVTASHTTAMHSYSDAYMGRRIHGFIDSKINFVANPLVNVSLQGKFDTFPKRRGITRVKELLEFGLNVSFGHDDIQDPWYPIGDGNLLEVLSMGLHLTHMLSHEEIMNAYKLITYNGAKTLHIDDKNYGIKEGNPANFIVLNADNFYNVMINKSTVLYSVRNGKILSETKPATTKLSL